MIAGNRLIVILGIAVALIGCNGNSYYNQVNHFPETELADHWTLKLPKSIQKSSTKDKLYQLVFNFSNDSMILKLSIDSISPGDALTNLKSRVEDEQNGIATGSCLGGFEGYAKFYNFLDTLNGLSGTILDLEESGKKRVIFRIEEVQTGNRLDLAFESISSERKDLIHAMSKFIKYIP
jgi:hypothetical protein